ncbi:two-component system response regulator [Fusibacter sp. 3D3]|uniref:response regulator n=1 Tax=Fusibacter sp. 3D3 TaxID=1048380 RepID=UPI000855E6B1|nr:response regulator [Fusibacter sp. 3D3]GAU78463.1 alkaline phosphatase synthesis transcriptional regulatory protein PhoP [Fusibacter sp. 3D3]
MSSLEPIKILIIDDEPDILFTLKEICDFCDYEAMTTTSGQEGYEIVKNELLDMVIVDYHMPGWDGLTTVKKLRSLKADLPILVLTVDEQQETCDKFIAVGATDFSIKPIKAPDLISRIKVNLQIHEIQKKMTAKKEEVYLEKGICEATLRHVTDFLVKQNAEVTFEDITAGVNLAYKTVHRYIQYLEKNDFLEIIPIYGNLGRPKNKYKLCDDFDPSKL